MKMPSRDAYGGGGGGGGMTTSSRTQTVFHNCWKTYKVSTLYHHTLCMLTRHGVYSRAAFIALSTSAFIRGRRLFAEIQYFRNIEWQKLRKHFLALPIKDIWKPVNIVASMFALSLCSSISTQEWQLYTVTTSMGTRTHADDKTNLAAIPHL